MCLKDLLHASFSVFFGKACVLRLHIQQMRKSPSLSGALVGSISVRSREWRSIHAAAFFQALAKRGVFCGQMFHAILGRHGNKRCSHAYLFSFFHLGNGALDVYVYYNRFLPARMNKFLEIPAAPGKELYNGLKLCDKM